MRFTDWLGRARRGAHRATPARNGRGRRRAGIAAAAAFATALLGAVPALAAEPAPTAEAPAARWLAVDAADAPVIGAVFEVQRLAADGSELGPTIRVADAVDAAGVADPAAIDHDAEPGAFSISALASGSGAREALVSGDVLRVRLAPGDAGEAAGAWTEVVAATAGASPQPVRAEPVAPESTTEPPVTDPPVTDPPATETPATEPPATEQPATEPPATEQPATEQPATEQPAAETTDPAPSTPLARADAAIAPLAAGPDAPDVTAPYVYWRAVDPSGALVPGATFALQGPRQNGANWGTTVTVTDCTSAPCTGLDRDPDPGEFQVKYLSPATNPTSNGVATTGRYRVQQTAAPAGFAGPGTAWREIPGSGNTGAWGGTTYNFGDFVNTPIPPAKIIVSTGGDRTAAGGITKLAGVTLLLNTGTTAPSGTRPDGVSGSGAGWARCVSDTNGECVFEVPNTQTGGANRNSRFWVVQPSDGVPSGWFTNTALGTGPNGGASLSDYRFRTGSALQSGESYRSTSDFMYNSSEDTSTASNGIWQQSRANPALTQSCGIDVALILDLSGSVSGSVGALKSAAGAFADALVGTPSRMSLFSFSDSSPATSAGQNYPALTSVATQAQADAFKSRWASWNANGGTNWDEALATAARERATNPYDVAVVITDGQPTFWGPNASGPGNATRFTEVENGIFSANLLKAQDTRVIAFGVGAGVSGAANAANLRAISGPTAGSDYYQTSNYADAGNTLRALAQGACKGQLTVTKMIVPRGTPAGQTTGAIPAPAGWEFTVSNPGAGATLPTPATRVTEDDGTGTVAFPLSFAGGTTSAAVTLAETQQPGYQIVPVGGQNAVCTNLVTQQRVTPVANVTDGVRVTVPQNEAVNCVVYNRAPDLAATVQVDKVWRVVDETGAQTGSFRIPGDEGSLPDGLGATATLSGPGGAGQTPQTWGSPRAGYQSGGSVTVDETTAIDAAKLPGCTLTSQRLTQRGGSSVDEALPAQTTLVPGANTLQITNTVRCVSTLTLLKQVSGGTASSAGWDLTATPDGGGQPRTVSGANTRSAANTFAVVPARGYALSEALHDPATPLAYLLDRVERCLPDATQAGGCSWQRVDERDSVTVGIGQHAVYRFVNVPAPALEVPLTGGVSSDALSIAGAGLAAIALLAASAIWVRRRRGLRLR
ncbi:vWA domain-containing protein [Leucobacter sp. PH1c]|uniref:vWA domain-containing protein n=1 Tax=Leucobacter sp. PH1c TaxID=1397278 RepID=UPI00046AEAFA|nr:vWA domain-containing protein [Leucobacter sp. PH1c]